MTTRYLFAGYTCAPAPDAVQFLSPLTPPANYKKPDTIREWFDRAEEARREEAAFLPVLGRLTAAVLLGEGGEVVFETTEQPGDPVGAVGMRVSRFVSETARATFGVPTTFALGAGLFARRVVLDGIRLCPDRLDDVLGASHLVGLWAVDPYDRAVPEKVRRYVSAENLARWLGGVPAADLSTAAGTAAFARGLAVRLGMVGRPALTHYLGGHESPDAGDGPHWTGS